MGRVRAEGFTMVEVMVTLAILAILTAMAAPAFTSLIESQRAQSASTDLFIGLTRARSEALRLNQNVALTGKSGGNDWSTGWQVQAVDAMDLPTGAVLEDFGPVRSPITVTANQTAIIYRNTGRIKNTAQPISVTGNISSSARCVCVNLSGRPTIISGSCPTSC